MKCSKSEKSGERNGKKAEKEKLKIRELNFSLGARAAVCTAVLC